MDSVTKIMRDSTRIYGKGIPDWVVVDGIAYRPKRPKNEKYSIDWFRCPDDVPEETEN